VLAFVKTVILPISRLSGDAKFFINREDRFGGPVTYRFYEELEADFAADKLSPQDLKLGVSDAINNLLAPIRKEFADSTEIQDIERAAYPPPPAKSKKEKKQKDRGTKAPDGEADAQGSVGAGVDEALDTLKIDTSTGTKAT